MNKLSLEDLKLRADAVASQDLLATISGGTENACHDEPEEKEKTKVKYELGVEAGYDKNGPNGKATFKITW